MIIFESNRSIVASGQYYVISTSSESESQWKSLNEKEFTSALKKVSESLTRSSQEKVILCKSVYLRTCCNCFLQCMFFSLHNV